MDLVQFPPPLIDTIDFSGDSRYANYNLLSVLFVFLINGLVFFISLFLYLIFYKFIFYNFIFYMFIFDTLLFYTYICYTFHFLYGLFVYLGPFVLGNGPLVLSNGPHV